MGVSKNRDTPKWMVKIMENPIKMDDLVGKHPLFSEASISRHFGIPNLWDPRFGKAGIQGGPGGGPGGGLVALLRCWEFPMCFWCSVVPCWEPKIFKIS